MDSKLYDLLTPAIVCVNYLNITGVDDRDNTKVRAFSWERK